MNLGSGQTTVGVASVLNKHVDHSVDPHLERIRNEAIGDDSDEEVIFLFLLRCVGVYILKFFNTHIVEISAHII